jgi:ABC-type sugar transport system ATPase subunit
MISHNMPDVFAVADRVTILRLGRTMRTVRREETSQEELVGIMTGAYEVKP